MLRTNYQRSDPRSVPREVFSRVPDHRMLCLATLKALGLQEATLAVAHRILRCLHDHL